jgi:hypothetical protein
MTDTRNNIINSTLEMIKNVHILNSNSGVTDLSALGNVHTLNLRYCEGVTDVSALGNVHTLNLTILHDIHDIQNNDKGPE